MSISYADCLSDLLCSEESGEVISAGDSPEISSECESPVIIDDDESIIAGFIEEERNSFTSFIASGDSDPGSLSPSTTTTTTAVSNSSPLLDSSARSRSVAWIFKVRAFYGFQAETAYLAVNYLDRFLSCHHIPQTGGWPLQLLSVACLSLAAKMEEPLVPSLLDIQVESKKFVFEPKTIQRMELLVLTVLNWRLRLVTPFTFISFFAYKVDVTGSYIGLLISQSTDLILSNIREGSLVEYWPSSIAAAAILCAASEIPSLSFVTPEHAESWCDGLCKEKIMDCYKLMQQFVVDHRRRKSIKVIPQLRVTAKITKIRSFNDSSPSSSSTSSPSPFSIKRRRLNNNHSWMDDDHDL
ncbi:cyclin-D1-1-like isoform X2 [Chenopodium quinoa]|uniref:cyclin-D1-1-like isoform X2 n=1 Tax=Chenopodium quinoa TaxID=63459 RepID=UPI000B775E1E|nr:cyclin-D1-1-like isoform X2 [Chenopodium quinoa]